MSILPLSKRKLQYNLYPLLAGSVALPKLTLTIPDKSPEGPVIREDQLKALLERALPTHLYVMVSLFMFVMFLGLMWILSASSKRKSCVAGSSAYYLNYIHCIKIFVNC